jgi:hypothetical protein
MQFPNSKQLVILLFLAIGLVSFFGRVPLVLGNPNAGDGINNLTDWTINSSYAVIAYISPGSCLQNGSILDCPTTVTFTPSSTINFNDWGGGWAFSFEIPQFSTSTYCFVGGFAGYCGAQHGFNGQGVYPVGSSTEVSSWLGGLGFGDGTELGLEVGCYDVGTLPCILNAGQAYSLNIDLLWAHDAGQPPLVTDGESMTMVIWNDIPPSLSSLQQYKSDATSTIPEGATTTESIVVFGAKLQSTTSSNESLQVEVKPADVSFTNTVTVSSTYVTPGSNAMATYALFPESSSNGGYHWQARVVDKNNNFSAWQSFGLNPSSTDFIINTVPLYTQQASPYPSFASTTIWASSTYDNALPGTQCGTGVNSSTIAACGCAITSVVMDLRYLGITTNVSGTDVNPLTLNKWLASTTGGYDDQGYLNWLKIPVYVGGLVTYSNTGTISSYLNATTTTPVILYEKSVPLNNATTTHFVVASGYAYNAGTSTYTIRDSYWYDTKYFNQTKMVISTHVQNYNNHYDAIDLLIPTSLEFGPQGMSLPAYIQYIVNLPNSLMLIDSYGRRTGKDSYGTEYNEIPGTSYQEQERSGHLLFYTPPTGRYTIEVIGNQTGKYSLSNEVSDGQRDPVYQVLHGDIITDQAITYVQDYDSNNMASSTVVLAQ